MRMLAEARIGRLVSVENAHEIHDALVRERRQVMPASGADVSSLLVCLDRGWIDDEMGPKKPVPVLHGDQEQVDEVSINSIHVSILAARLLAKGVRPSTLMLIAAVREIQNHLRDDAELAEEFKRMHTDVMCDRRHAQWRVESP
jgi:hypothetical protein